MGLTRLTATLYIWSKHLSEQTFACSKIITEAVEKGVKFVRPICDYTRHISLNSFMTEVPAI